jgi:hypothetical protein
VETSRLCSKRSNANRPREAICSECRSDIGITIGGSRYVKYFKVVDGRGRAGRLGASHQAI